MSFTAPQTYKAAAFKTKGGPLEIVDIVWKDPKEGEIVVKVLACGVCATDATIKYEIMTTLPRIPGHEIVGDVVSVPPNEKRWKVGQRVGGGWHGGHCHTCRRCNSGDFATCENVNYNGCWSDGGYAEFVMLRSESVLSVPDTMDPAEAAPLLCAGITTFNSLRTMDVKPGDIVAVQGIGGLGHLGIQFSRAMGYHTIALSSSDSKEALAKELGAHEYVDGSKVNQAEYLQKLGGAKVIMCTAPNPAIVKTLVDALTVNGILLLLTVIPELTIPGLPLISKRLSVRGWPAGTAKDSEDTLKFANLAGVRCHVERFPLSKANEAYASMESGKARFRAVIVNE